jgi:ubiquinol-cytochrome c reductase iron-sulfur subunit
VNRVARWMVLAVLALLGRRRARHPAAAPPPPPPPWRPPGQEVAETDEVEVPRDLRAEALTAVLLVLAGTCAAGFVVFYFVYSDTQWYGLTLGLGLAFLAAALILAGKRVVAQETAIEEREIFGDAHEQHQVSTLVKDGGKGISRRALLGGAAAVAGAGLGAAVVLPIASLGPNANEILAGSPWRPGRALVDEHGKPLGPDDLPVGGFLTAFPEGASREDVASPVVLCRMLPQELELPAERRTWAVEGIVAYSKTCTHAGCAVAMFRYPLYHPNEPHPALVCPCHYSTFDPRRGATVTFGPASRPLPQLPIGLDADGHFIATGPLSGPAGPSYGRVRLQDDA